LTDLSPNQFWERKFIEEGTSWGFEPADSAIIAKNLFLEKNIKNILIPGIGYGRNARIFVECGIKVTGIEISQRAIELAKKANNLDITIHHGSVTEMPFDNAQYDGIFCYALIHLLNKRERMNFIHDCYQQLQTGGLMIFTLVSFKANMYGGGKFLSRNRFQIGKGISVFFYDKHSIEAEFGTFGLKEFHEIDEPIKHMKHEPPLKCYMIICIKP